jgi:FdhD protein
VGCGLCGLESLAEVTRAVPPVTAALDLTAGDLRDAVAALARHQPLHDATRAAHAAAFVVPGQGIVMAREDVGRHNALDKLAGALLSAGMPAACGAVLMTSRVSVDLVQKVARMGVPILAALSAPTAAAVDLASAAGITLVGAARADRFEVFANPQRISVQGATVAA